MRGFAERSATGGDIRGSWSETEASQLLSGLASPPRPTSGPAKPASERGDGWGLTGNINGANIIYFGGKNFTFKETLLFGNKDTNTFSIALADFNKDGFMDIVTGNYLKPNTVFMNLDGKTFDAINLTERASRTYGVTVGDINADGWMDVVIANSDDFNLYYLNIFNKK